MKKDINYANQEHDYSEIDLKEMITILWEKKILVIFLTLFSSLFSIFYAFSLPDIYRSEALLLPNSNQSQNGLSSLAGQFGGLASLAGINLGTNQVDNTDFALKVMTSREFVYQFIETNNLKPDILAVTDWDKKSGSLIYDDEIYDFSNNLWHGNDDSLTEPSLHEAYKKFIEEHLSVSREKDSGMVEIAIKHFSPNLAKTIVEKLISQINSTIKSQDMAEAEKSIKYLENELKLVENASAQSMFYQLIEQQHQKLMLTKVRDDYIFKVVDSPVVPEKKISPKKSLICIVGFAVGLALSVLLVIALRLVNLKGR